MMHPIAWRTLDGTIDFAELESRTRRAAFNLQRMGVRPGEFWAVRGLSALDTFTLILAGFWQKLVMLPLPDRLPAAVHDQMMQGVPLQGCIEQFSFEGDELSGPMQFDEGRLGIFTTGSTGTPKAIIHTWTSLRASALATNAFYKVEAGDSWLLSLDIAHIGGFQIAMRCFLAGAVIWHLAEPKALAAVLCVEAPTFISLVPTQLYRLMTVENLRHCRAIILGGAAASVALVEQAVSSGLAVSVSYGSSETAAQCTALPPGIIPQSAGDVGALLPGWEYSASGETLRIRGPAAYLGHYQSKKFHSALDAEGWMTLPDRILCENGRLTILGRADGIFQVAGENVAPADIIQPLESLRAQADFLALPDADAEYGTVPVLIVRSPTQPPLNEIISLCQKNLNGVQRPRRIYWDRSDEISKPSRSFYENALRLKQLPMVWSQDLGRI